MDLRFVIFLIIAALSAPAVFAQGTNQPTVDELVAKNVEAKGGATALNKLQTLRSTGKLLVPVQGQIELGYLQTKKRPEYSIFRVENCAVILSKALQRNAKHEARLSNVSGVFPFGAHSNKKSEIESLASPRTLSALRCNFASLRMTNE